MTKQFTIQCPACRHDHKFTAEGVPKLSDYIAQREDAARAEGREEMCDFEGDWHDVSSLTHPLGTRVLRELAAAVKRGDRAEARQQLDRLAEALGGNAAHEIELGWFSPDPHRPASTSGTAQTDAMVPA